MHGMNPEIGHIASGRGRGLRRAARRWVFGAGIALISGAAVWYGWSWWTVGRFIESTDDAYVGGEVTTISSKVAGFVGAVAIAGGGVVRRALRCGVPSRTPRQGHRTRHLAANP